MSREKVKIELALFMGLACLSLTVYFVKDESNLSLTLVFTNSAKSYFQGNGFCSQRGSLTPQLSQTHLEVATFVNISSFFCSSSSPPVLMKQTAKDLFRMKFLCFGSNLLKYLVPYKPKNSFKEKTVLSLTLPELLAREGRLPSPKRRLRKSIFWQ